MLRKQWTGAVIPTTLAKLLRDFDAYPCKATALALIRFDEGFRATFELAQKSTMFESAFKESKEGSALNQEDSSAIIWALLGL